MRTHCRWNQTCLKVTETGDENCKRTNQFGPIRKVISIIAEKIRSEIPPADISEVMGQVDELLDKSVSTEGYVIRPSATEQNYIDLSQIDFEALKEKF